MTKKKAEKEVIKNIVDWSNIFCPVINSKCKTVGCISFKKGKISQDEDGWDFDYKAYCNCPLVTGIMYYVEK